jgi:hypothetical protein
MRMVNSSRICRAKLPAEHDGSLMAIGDEMRSAALTRSLASAYGAAMPDISAFRGPIQ